MREGRGGRGCLRRKEMGVWAGGSECGLVIFD